MLLSSAYAFSFCDKNDTEFCDVAGTRQLVRTILKHRLVSVEPTHNMMRKKKRKHVELTSTSGQISECRLNILS